MMIFVLRVKLLDKEQQPEGSQVTYNFSTPNGKMGVTWVLTRPTSKVALTVKE